MSGCAGGCVSVCIGVCVRVCKEIGEREGGVRELGARITAKFVILVASTHAHQSQIHTLSHTRLPQRR